MILNSLSDNQLVTMIHDGAVGILPTDTVYGLVCSAANHEAVERLYKLKHRENKPGTIIAANIQQLVELGLKERYLRPVAAYWPNSLSIVIPCGPELAYLHMDKHSLAVRIPKEPQIQSLLALVGPLLTSSANQPGEQPANNLNEARAYFGEAVDYYVDGGDLSGRESSTVIRVIDDEIDVLREGAVTFNEKGEIA